jgi:hypothetical protein
VRKILQKGDSCRILSPVQMPRQLRTLDDLLAQAEHYANYSIRNMGRVPPTLLLIGADGPVLFIPESMTDDRAKDDFATTARLIKAMLKVKGVKFAQPEHTPRLPRGRR